MNNNENTSSPFQIRDMDDETIDEFETVEDAIDAAIALVNEAQFAGEHVTYDVYNTRIRRIVWSS